MAVVKRVRRHLGRIDHTRASNLDHIARLQAVFGDSNIVHECAALTLHIKQHICAAAQTQLNMMARNIGIEDDNIILFAATNVVKACAPLLRRSGGAIVCISSICGVEALGCPLPYGAAKAALNSYVRGAARWQ